MYWAYTAKLESYDLLELLLTWYLAEYLTHFHKTYVNDALWDSDERVTFWGQKVKGQGHGEIKYAGKSTFIFHNSSGRRNTVVDNPGWHRVTFI